MKKLITALIGTGLFLSCHSYAFSPNYKSGGFYVGATGYWLLATGAGVDLDSHTVQFIDHDTANTDNYNFFHSPTATFRSEIREFDPDYDWAYELKAGYDFPCSPYNLELSYMHFDGDTTELNEDFDKKSKAVSVSNPFFTNLILPIFPGEAAFPATALSQAPLGFTDLDLHSSLRYEFDKVDLLFGRHYDILGRHFKLRPSIGIRYARIDRDYHLDANGVFAVEPVENFVFSDDLDLHANVHSQFKGVGPVFNLDTRYGFCGGFGIVAHFDTSLLVGTVNADNNVIFEFTPRENDGIVVDSQDPAALLLASAAEVVDAPSKDRLVASISGKIGVDYSYCFCNRSILTFEVGYQASKYFDAFDVIRGDIQSPFSSSITGLPAQQRVTDIVSDNFDLRGPYVNVTYHL